MSILKNTKLNYYRVLSISAFVAYYGYLLIAYLEFYALPANYINEYVRLDLATYSLEYFDRWVEYSPIYDFIIITFPTLLLWNNAICRIAFYGIFISTYILHPTPNPTLTIIGLVSQGFYTFFIAGVGFLIYSDILRVNVLHKIILIISSIFYSSLVFFMATAVALASAFGAKNEREQFIEQHFSYAEQVTGLTIGTPPSQLFIFLLLSLGVFAKGKIRALLIFCSWVSLAVFIPMQVESNTYFLLADIYTILSATLFIHTLIRLHVSATSDAPV